MNRPAAAIAAFLCVSTFAVAFAGAPDTSGDRYWPQWRGPTGTGLAPHGDPPVEWSETKNLRWKVEIPGGGHATPIVWGDCVYVQTAIKTERKGEPEQSGEKPPDQGRGHRGGNWMGSAEPTNIHEFAIMALDRRTGKTLWKKVVSEELPHEGGHRDASQASGSPVTDGDHLFAFFGSRGLYCLDMRGEVIWRKDFGKMQTRMSFGEGTSPTLYGDTVIVNWDHEGQSYIVALDASTGKQRWKIDRDEHTSWATPHVVLANGKPQVVTSATKLIRSYDLTTGELIWKCAGMTVNVIPSPVSGDGLVFATSGFRGSALQAIRYADAKGDITDTAAVAWKYDGKGTPYVPSPLLYGDRLYFLSGNKAILSCVDAGTGRKLYAKTRLEGLDGAYASLVGAGNRVYITGRNGVTAVIRHGSEFELLATSSLDDSFTASPAIVDGELYLRGHKHLYCIARD